MRRRLGVMLVAAVALLGGCVEPTPEPRAGDVGADTSDVAAPEPVADAALCGRIPPEGIRPEGELPERDRRLHVVETEPDRASGGMLMEGSSVFAAGPDVPVRFEWDLDEVSMLAVLLTTFAEDSSLPEACFAVVTPTGERWTPGGAGAHMAWWAGFVDGWGQGYVLVPSTTDGTWTLEISGLPERDFVAAVGAFTTPYKLVVVDSGLARVGTPHVLEVSLVGTSGLLAGSVTGEWSDVATDATWPLAFRDDGEGSDTRGGDGVHTAVHTFEESGEYRLTVRAVAPEVTRHRSSGYAVVSADWEL